MAGSMNEALQEFYCAEFLRQAREQGKTASDLEQMGEEYLNFQRDMTDCEYQGLLDAIRILRQQDGQSS